MSSVPSAGDVDHGASPSTVAALVASHRPGHALAREFYVDPAIHARDLERIFMRDWLYACHASALPAPGDYHLFEVGKESVIVVRGDDGVIRALANVCRHRGSRICETATGNARALVCPYHGWAYGLDGRLRAARHTDSHFDRDSHGLLELRCEVFHGLVMVSLGGEPPPLSIAHELLDEALAPFDLGDARVATSRVYPVAANWKLAIENYMECYHCGPAHPDYARRHWLAQPSERWAEHKTDMLERAAQAGVRPKAVDRYGTRAVDALQLYLDRTPLREGYLTGSEDGKPVAPLLGSLTEYDGGGTDLMLGPATFALVYNDHAVIYRFTPRAVQECDMELTWLVRGDAREGHDYDLDRLTWLWEVTTLADKRIITLNQAGVDSAFYRPGPYALMEEGPRRFTEWYLATIA